MTVMLASARSRDPRDRAPVGCYLTDGHVMIEVLESDYSGAIGANVVTGYLLELDPVALMQGWTRVRPDGLGGVRERARVAGASVVDGAAR